MRWSRLSQSTPAGIWLSYTIPFYSGRLRTRGGVKHTLYAERGALEYLKGCLHAEGRKTSIAMQKRRTSLEWMWEEKAEGRGANNILNACSFADFLHQLPSNTDCHPTQTPWELILNAVYVDYVLFLVRFQLQCQSTTQPYNIHTWL